MGWMCMHCVLSCALWALYWIEPGFCEAQVLSRPCRNGSLRFLTVEVLNARHRLYFDSFQTGLVSQKSGLVLHF